MRLNIPRSAVIFSGKNLIAGMCALYIALAAGLENPAWAVVTAYIVAQPHAGASLSKATFRLAGTFVGVCVAIFMVPPLVQTPALLNLTLAIWLGICVAASLIDRTSRSYFFALAGYTSCIVIFPILTHPQDIFTYGLSRFEEISIGIVCSAVVHAVLLPVSTVPILSKHLEQTLNDSKAVCIEALTPDVPERVAPDRRQLAVAINELHELLLHASFDSPYRMAELLTIRTAISRLERLVPLSMAVTDRIDELYLNGALHDDLKKFLEEVRKWFACEEPNLQISEADAILRRSEHLKPVPDNAINWQEALIYNLTERVVDLIQQYVAFLKISRIIEYAHVVREYSPTERKRISRKRYPLLPRAIDRDWRGAVGAGLATAITMFLGNILWIKSGWADGYSAAMMAGVYFAVYSGTPNPSLMLKNKFFGVVLRLLIGLIYMEAILPTASSFEAMILVLAPALLIIGIMMALPKYSALSFNFVIGIFNPTIVDRTFHPGFELYVNSGLATLTGIYFAMFMMSMTRFLWVDGMVRRNLTAGRRDIAFLRYISRDAQPLWRSRMAHRIGLLTPRMATTFSNNGVQPDDALRDMMIGGALSQLYTSCVDAPPAVHKLGQKLVLNVADYYRKLLHQPDLPPSEALRKQIDDCFVHTAACPTLMLGMILALTSLRRNMFPTVHSAPGLD